MTVRSQEREAVGIHESQRIHIHRTPKRSYSLVEGFKLDLPHDTLDVSLSVLSLLVGQFPVTRPTVEPLSILEVIR